MMKIEQKNIITNAQVMTDISYLSINTIFLTQCLIPWE